MQTQIIHTTVTHTNITFMQCPKYSQQQQQQNSHLSIILLSPHVFYVILCFIHHFHYMALSCPSFQMTDAQNNTKLLSVINSYTYNKLYEKSLKCNKNKKFGKNCLALDSCKEIMHFLRYDK